MTTVMYDPVIGANMGLHDFEIDRAQSAAIFEFLASSLLGEQ